MHPIIWFILSLAGIVISAEILVSSLISFAKKSRLTTLFIGSLVLAFGTTFPELMNNIFSSLLKASPFGVGDAIGSFIANLALIFAITLFFFDFRIGEKNKRYALFMLISILLLVGLSLDRNLSRLDGAILITLFIVYQFITANLEKRDHLGKLFHVEMLYVFGATFLLVISAWSLVKSALAVATMLHTSLAFLGAVIVAFATSIPELMTALSSMTKREVELSRGNLFGANVSNVTLVIGIAALIRPIVVTPYLEFFMFYGLLVASVFVYLVSTGKASKGIGVVLLLLYIAFLISSSLGGFIS